MLFVPHLAGLSLPSRISLGREGRWGPAVGLSRGSGAELVLGFMSSGHFSGFQALRDLIGLDLLGLSPAALESRFRLRYLVLNVRNPCWLGIDISFSPGSWSTVSCQAVFPALGWPEREVWDFFGIGFSGCPDHRRLLSDYGFRGFPLRKDFPVSGYLELRYDAELCRVLCGPADFFQLYRSRDDGLSWLSPGQAPASQPPLVLCQPWPALAPPWLPGS